MENATLVHWGVNGDHTLFGLFCGDPIPSAPNYGYHFILTIQFDSEGNSIQDIAVKSVGGEDGQIYTLKAIPETSKQFLLINNNCESKLSNTLYPKSLEHLVQFVVVN